MKYTLQEKIDIKESYGINFLKQKYPWDYWQDRKDMLGYMKNLRKYLNTNEGIKIYKNYREIMKNQILHNRRNSPDIRYTDFNDYNENKSKPFWKFW